MKSYIKIVVFVCCLFTSAFAQEIKPFKVAIDFTLEESGDAKVSYSTKMNASQWDMFKKTTGTNQSLLKRELERALPGYFLSDFEYKEDAMNRSYSLTFNAYGMCKMTTNGKYSIDLDSKDPDVTKINDHTYMMISESSAGGQLVQTTQKIIFPESASDITQTKDSFGKAHFVFDMPGNSTSGKLMQYGGIGLMVIAAFLGFKKSKES
ncbi:MAG: hypothetical protein BWY67_00200 [Bacteroidetes bacterium ADurb.Bin397]|jgi:hypothetical protein|nr:MAG: hypothetical protein BWY67_00200 [Bacteroidetes bacterium ADurb.Bin397]